MSGTDRTSLGDRMKGYEASSTQRKAFKGQPLIARLDGKGFHTFCKGLTRPFDERLSKLMEQVTHHLVDRFQATVGYTQSDEITLAWITSPNETRELPYDGRFQKLESLLASTATAIFNNLLAEMIPEKKGAMALFDARAFVVPSVEEAYHAFLWRQQDATKNAISMAAHTHFSHKSLQGMHGPEMQERLMIEKGINFNDYPAFFKRGIFVKRVTRFKWLTAEELARIPKEKVPEQPIQRRIIETRDIWLSKQTDPITLLFTDLQPLEVHDAVS